VRSHQVALCGSAMFQGDLPELLVAGRIGGPEDQTNVHHDVDEQRLRTDERRQVAALLPAEGQRAAGFDQHVTEARITSQAVPAQISRKEDEAEVVNVPVMLAWL